MKALLVVFFYLFFLGDLGKAVGSLVNVMTDDQSPGLTDEED